MLIALTIKNNRQIKSGLTNIKIRISHKGESRYVSTKYYILPGQWKDGQVVDNINAKIINIELSQLMLNCQRKLLNIDPNKTAISRLVELLTLKTEINDFSNYFERFIIEKEGGNHRTAEIYAATLEKIKKFDKRDPIMFEDVTPGWLFRFESFLKKQGLSTSSVAISLRNVRAIINHAIDNEVIGQNLYPFRRFKINNPKQGDIKQKGLAIEQIKKIRDFETDWPVISLARDVWMLELYLIGINNDDLYHAETITGNGRLTYSRAKTGRKYSIKLEPEAKELMTKLKGKKSLLCLSEKYSSVHAMTQSLNKALKKIMPELTMYHARHSWATVAFSECKSMDMVGASLGHSKKNVTSGYVNISQDSIDKLNRSVLDCLK